MRRQTTGETARFLPPGHSSRLKDIGQFSMPILIPCSSANPIMGLQIFKKRGQFSSTVLVQSRPTKVLVFPKSELLGCEDDFFEVADRMLGSRRIRIEGVRDKSAQSRDADAATCAKRPEIVGLSLSKPGDINVGNTCKFPLGLPSRPARHFQARKVVLCGEFKDFTERKVRQNSGKESQFHISSWCVERTPGIRLKCLSYRQYHSINPLSAAGDDRVC